MHYGKECGEFLGALIALPMVLVIKLVKLCKKLHKGGKHE